MNAYAPTRPEVVAGLAVGAAVVLALGFVLRRLRPLGLSRTAAWAVVAGATLFAHRATVDEPPGVRMLAVCTLLLYAMKAVVGVEGEGPKLSPLQWLAFSVGWPGMQPAAFRHLGGPALPGAGRLIRGGALRLAIGLALLAAARGLWVSTHSAWAATPFLLAGLSVAFHFGLFNVVAGLWRFAGVDANALFRAPLASTTLREFWGRRWNLAFSVMTAATVYRPVSAKAGRFAGLLLGFLASGIFHELAISLPVRTGYGGPLAYFLLHGVLVAVEGRRPALGRTWTLFWVVAPVPLLFHRPFLAGVVWPIVGATG